MTEVRRLLALDTSQSRGSLALVAAEADGAPRVVAEIDREMSGSHAISLPGEIDRLLAEAGWSKTDPELYVATLGPGSFTGLRIGLGTLRGLSLASGKPAVGVGTLPALAEAFGPAEGNRLALLVAGRGEVYGACYDPRASPPRELVPPWVGPPERVAELVSAHGPLVYFGPGAAAVTSALGEAAGQEQAAPAGLAGAAGRLALLDPGATRSGAELAPLYVRPPDARPA